HPALLVELLDGHRDAVAPARVDAREVARHAARHPDLDGLARLRERERGRGEEKGGGDEEPGHGVSFRDAQSDPWCVHAMSPTGGSQAKVATCSMMRAVPTTSGEARMSRTFAAAVVVAVPIAKIQDRIK